MDSNCKLFCLKMLSNVWDFYEMIALQDMTKYRQCTTNFPDAWKTARITPIPKIAQPVELKDNRPVSVLPFLSKVYEKLVSQQLAVFIERETVYHQYQSNYRKNHSTATLLLKLHNDINKAMKSSAVTIAIFTDYSKAFDTTDFSIFIKKDAYT